MKMEKKSAEKYLVEISTFWKKNQFYFFLEKISYKPFKK